MRERFACARGEPVASPQRARGEPGEPAASPRPGSPADPLRASTALPLGRALHHPLARAAVGQHDAARDQVRPASGPRGLHLRLLVLLLEPLPLCARRLGRRGAGRGRGGRRSLLLLLLGLALLVLLLRLLLLLLHTAALLVAALLLLLLLLLPLDLRLDHLGHDGLPLLPQLRRQLHVLEARLDVRHGGEARRDKTASGHLASGRAALCPGPRLEP
mmetsp:Transcript_59673/g.156861  ORF Transcript_59673/g.156861 Transcript_59673/m.156861 type:complete len:217 (+) Transcript_59673:46-696(+)